MSIWGGGGGITSKQMKRKKLKLNLRYLIMKKLSESKKSRSLFQNLVVRNTKLISQMEIRCC